MKKGAIIKITRIHANHTSNTINSENFAFAEGEESKIGLSLAIAQVISRRLPTALPRVRSQVRSRGICGIQSGTGAGFLRVLRSPLSVLLPSNGPYPSIIRGWYRRPISGRRNKWIQSHPTARKKRPKVYNLNCSIQEKVSIMDSGIKEELKL
jgi:hypothetical protein